MKLSLDEGLFVAAMLWLVSKYGLVRIENKEISEIYKFPYEFLNIASGIAFTGGLAIKVFGK